jgi:hypothetical protein
MAESYPDEVTYGLRGRHLQTMDDVLRLQSHLLEFYIYFKQQLKTRRAAFVPHLGGIHIIIEENVSVAFRSIAYHFNETGFFNSLAYFSATGQLPGYRGVPFMHFDNGSDAREAVRLVSQRGSISPEHPVYGISEGARSVRHGEEGPFGDMDPRYTSDMANEMAMYLNATIQAATPDSAHELALEMVGIVFGIIMDNNTTSADEMNDFVAKYLISLAAVFPAFTGGNKQNAIRFMRVRDPETHREQVIPYPTVGELDEVIKHILGGRTFLASTAVAGGIAIAGAILHNDRLPDVLTPLAGLVSAGITGATFTVGNISAALSGGASSATAALLSPAGVGVCSLIAMLGVIDVVTRGAPSSFVARRIFHRAVKSRDSKKSMAASVKRGTEKVKHQGVTLWRGMVVTERMHTRNAVVSSHTNQLLNGLMFIFNGRVQDVLTGDIYTQDLGRHLFRFVNDTQDEEPAAAAFLESSLSVVQPVVGDKEEEITELREKLKLEEEDLPPLYGEYSEQAVLVVREPLPRLGLPQSRKSVRPQAKAEAEVGPLPRFGDPSRVSSSGLPRFGAPTPSEERMNPLHAPSSHSRRRSRARERPSRKRTQDDMPSDPPQLTRQRTYEPPKGGSKRLKKRKRQTKKI